MWVAGILLFATGTAGTAKRGLQASSSSPQAPAARQNVCCRHFSHRMIHPQAPQTLQISGAGMPARLGF